MFVLFEVVDLDEALAFVTSPEVPEAKEKSVVVGDTRIYFPGRESPSMHSGARYKPLQSNKMVAVRPKRERRSASIQGVQWQFEPPTVGLEVRCSIHLSYGRAWPNKLS